ncbi:hypothetical protein TrLO_g13777 [Triparma laevis f. longispina]|uniref:Uncharacterized protein n=1 Tax=Triparma laevis f. longispina TaxID=1714387 RepID=A0A9W7E5F4_9STRA|nr:hypothetical protein TrLO_g13777 [Triparma laevis f. longispina]
METPDKSNSQAEDLRIATELLSPNPGEEQVLSSPDRRQIIQRLLAEKRRVRDAAIDSATKFTAHVSDAMNKASDMVDNANNGGVGGQELGQTLSMNDLETGEDRENETPNPYQDNLRSHMMNSSGGGGGVGKLVKEKKVGVKKTVTVQPKPAAKPTTLAQEPSFMTRRASVEMKDRQMRAVKEEMMSECTFSPSIKTLPSSYGKGRGKIDESFEERSARWAQTKEDNLSRSKQRAQDNELEDCTFEPTLSTDGRVDGRGNMLGSAQRVRQNNGTPGVVSEQETVQRLYYVETKRLEERRNREALEHKRKEEEEFKKSCTFRPDRSARTTSQGDELWQQATSKYLTSSTAAVERRQLVLAHPDLASPGPGEYTEDVEPEGMGGGYGFDPLMLGFSGTGLRMGGGGSTATKSWSFAPKTNEVDKKYQQVREYLKEDVVERLNKLARPEHKFVLSKVGAEEAEGEGDLRSSLRSKDAARKDFHEFLSRQNALEIKRKEHKANLTAAETPDFNPKISKKTKEIHEMNNRGTFLQRVERNESKRETLLNRLSAQAKNIPEECTFQPSILRKSSNMPQRTPRDMSLGDAEEREIKTRALRIKVESEELSKYSFRPTMNTTYQTIANKQAEGTIKVVEEGGATYMTRLKEAVEKKEARVNEMKKDLVKKEMEGCTFKPQIVDCPSYVKRIAHSMQISRKHKERFGKKQEMPSWK